VRHLERLEEVLVREGLLRNEEQNNNAGESRNSARVVAPFDMSEIEVGQVLGTGGFSSVFEVCAFHPRRRSKANQDPNGKKLTRNEELSRQYLIDHAQIHPDDIIVDHEKKLAALKLDEDGPKKRKCLITTSSHGGGYSFPYSRYAVKHLRNGLVTRSPDKFKRAAIDLVLEGQLLVILDHPNIVRIHGRSAKGPEAFRSGNPRDYFLIMDKLPTTLEEQMWQWKTKSIKYRKRLQRRSARKGGCVSSWVRRKLRRKPDEGKADQPQQPDKYEIKLQDVWLERLRTAMGIASAVNYMHSKRLIHRDLKTSNIGFDARNEVKLFDLGLSRLLPSEKDDFSSCTSVSALKDGYVMSRVGTRFYMSPEVRKKERYSLSADVYSFGMCLWELLSMSSPRDVYQQRKEELVKKAPKKRKGGGSTNEDAYNAFKEVVKNESAANWLPICPCWPQELQDLIKACLSYEASDRPSMATVESILKRHVENVANGPGTDTNAQLRSTSRVEEIKEEETEIFDEGITP